MNSPLVQQYQSHVLGPKEVVEYNVIIRQVYPPYAIQSEPFIGFKILCKDTNASMCNPGDRLRQIDSHLGCLIGKGCLLRETTSDMPDGIWVMSLPVPRSHMDKALNNLFDVLATIEQRLGIIKYGLYEVNVSGKCHYTELERSLMGIHIPKRYKQFLVIPDNTPYNLGHVIRINDYFMMLRTRWNFPPSNPQTCFDDLTVIAQLTSSMYH